MFNFKDKLIELRKSRGMTQDELAKRCGYADRSMITKISGSAPLRPDQKRAARLHRK